MRVRSSLSSLAFFLFSLQGCGAAFTVRGKDPSLALNATADASTPSPANASMEPRVVVSQITGLTVHAAGQVGRAQSIHGGAIAIEYPGAIQAHDIVGGDFEIDASAVEGAPCEVRGGTIRLAGGVELRVNGGRITLGANREGQWVVSHGRVTTVDSSPHVAVTTPLPGNSGAGTPSPTLSSARSTATDTSVAPGPSTVIVQGTMASAAPTTATLVTPSAPSANGRVGTAPSSSPAAPLPTGIGNSAHAPVLGRVSGVGVQRIHALGGMHVVAGGAITLAGIPQGEDCMVIDGSLEFDDPEFASTALDRGARVVVRASPRRSLRVRAGGTLLVGNRHGRRWRVRVEGGEIIARTEGSNPSGRVVWQPTGGELRVTVLATGGDTLALEGGGLPEATVDFSPRVRAALDALIASATPGSREAGRLASAVQVVLRQAESAEPSFYAIPVRGRSLVVMIDISYSMSDPDPNGAGFAYVPSKLDVARAELVKVLASVPSDTVVNVIAFSSAVHRLWDAPRSMDDVSLRTAIQWAAALRPTDETHPLDALNAAAAMNPEQIVLLSDGRPSNSEAVLRSLLARVEELAPRTRIDVVGFGADQDRIFLGALAARGRGTLRLR